MGRMDWKHLSFPRAETLLKASFPDLYDGDNRMDMLMELCLVHMQWGKEGRK